MLRGCFNLISGVIPFRYPNEILVKSSDFKTLFFRLDLGRKDG